MLATRSATADPASRANSAAARHGPGMAGRVRCLHQRPPRHPARLPAAFRAAAVAAGEPGCRQPDTARVGAHPRPLDGDAHQIAAGLPRPARPGTAVGPGRAARRGPPGPSNRSDPGIDASRGRPLSPRRACRSNQSPSPRHPTAGGAHHRSEPGDPARSGPVPRTSTASPTGPSSGTAPIESFLNQRPGRRSTNPVGSTPLLPLDPSPPPHPGRSHPPGSSGSGCALSKASPSPASSNAR